MANGLLASFAAFFNGGNGPSSSSSKSAFGSGLPSSSRRAPPRSLSGDGTLPYAQYNGRFAASASNGGLHEAPNARPSPYGINGKDASSSQLGMPAPFPAATGARSGATLSTNVSIPSTAYPPLRHTWNRIRTWCDNNYTELADTLNWPAIDAQLDELEYTIGFSLPPAVRDSYLCYDGQELESKLSCSDGLFFGLPLLSLDQIAEEWRFWRSVDDDPSTGANEEVKAWMNSCPAGWVRPEYSCRGWIPLITDRVGNYIGIDLTPGAGGGAPGQVILFGRDFDTKIVLWRGEGEGGWGRFLQYFAEELESGEMWTLEEPSSGSEDEEDGIGYESYFANGGSGAARGGGDRGGEGAAGFKLQGDYKGWPVLEAWADRSMRCWEEIGMPAGPTPWQADPPSLILPDGSPVSSREGAQLVDENGEAVDAEGSTSGARRRLSLETAVAAADNAGVKSHPLEDGSPVSDAGTVVPTTFEAHTHAQAVDAAAERRMADTLSPPLPSHRSRSKQKQREPSPLGPNGTNSGASTPTQVKRRPPPPPVSLDLPTIDDVRAAHAAALATQTGSGGQYHFDIERSARPPAGSGGLGMGMGMKARSSMGEGAAPIGRAAAGIMNHLTRGHRQSHEEDGLELSEARSSTEALYASQGRLGPGSSTTALSDVLIDGPGGRRPAGSPSLGGMASPRASTSSTLSRGNEVIGIGISTADLGPSTPYINGAGPSPGGSRTPRTLVSANGEIPNLIDPNSAPGSPAMGGGSMLPATSNAARYAVAAPKSIQSPPGSRTASVPGSPRMAPSSLASVVPAEPVPLN